MDGSTEVHYRLTEFRLGCSMDRSMEVPFDRSSLGCLTLGSIDGVSIGLLDGSLGRSSLGLLLGSNLLFLFLIDDCCKQLPTR